MIIAALPNLPSLALRLAGYLCATGAALALVVGVWRVIMLLISFAKDERHGKLALIGQAIGFPLGCCFILGALASGALFFEAQRYGREILGLVMVAL